MEVSQIVVDNFDCVQEVQMARRVQEIRRQGLVTNAAHQAHNERGFQLEGLIVAHQALNERGLQLRKLLAAKQAELATLLSQLECDDSGGAAATTATSPCHQPLGIFVATCEECGIEHSSLVGALCPDDGKWYCNGCWIEWNKSDSEEEDFDDSIFDEDDGLSLDVPERFKEIGEELFGSDETKTVPASTCLLAILYQDDPERRALGQEVYEKVSHLNRDTEDVSDGKITRRILDGGCSWIRALLDDDEAFATRVEEIRREESA